MLSYCLNCTDNTDNKSPKVVRTKNGRIILLSKCAVCNSKESKYFRQQEDRGILSNLTGVIILIRCDLPIRNILFWKYKMNKILNKLLLAGDKFMPTIHLKQSGFTYSACGPLKLKKE